jgi:hypothetical protein
MKIQQFDSRAEYEAYFNYVLVAYNSTKILNCFHSKKAGENYLKELPINGKITTRRKALKLGYKP